jgi:hypothetical protein
MSASGRMFALLAAISGSAILALESEMTSPAHATQDVTAGEAR